MRTEIAGLGVEQLARQFGSPTFVYDAAKIVERVADLQAFDNIRYAQKACSNLAILDLVRRHGVLVDAVSAGERYTRNVGRFESPETHEAFHVIMRAALHDDACRQYMVDLVNLSRVHTNEEFNYIQGQIHAAPGALGERLAMMTPEQVQAQAAIFRHAYDLIQDALPWLTDGLRTLLGQLGQGEFDAARRTMLSRYKNKYIEGSPTVQTEVGRVSPVEHYTVGGAPINVGKYRECVGCTCADPCADGSCESCCNCK